MKEIKIKPCKAISQGRWTHSTKKRFGAIVAKTSALCGAIIILLSGCKTIYVPVPATTSTTVNVKDSTVWNIKDSVRITEKSRYKDYGDLLKTLKIDGNRSHMTAWIDTTKNIINGELIEDPVKEKTRIEYRDKYIYKDSIQLVEKPIPIEVPVEVKYVPNVYKILSAIGLLTLLSVLGFIGFKIYQLKGKGFLNLIKNIFKK